MRSCACAPYNRPFYASVNERLRGQEALSRDRPLKYIGVNVNQVRVLDLIEDFAGVFASNDVDMSRAFERPVPADNRRWDLHAEFTHTDYPYHMHIRNWSMDRLRTVQRRTFDGMLAQRNSKEGTTVRFRVVGIVYVPRVLLALLVDFPDDIHEGSRDPQWVPHILVGHNNVEKPEVHVNALLLQLPIYLRMIGRPGNTRTSYTVNGFDLEVDRENDRPIRMVGAVLQFTINNQQCRGFVGRHRFQHVVYGSEVPGELWNEGVVEDAARKQYRYSVDDESGGYKTIGERFECEGSATLNPGKLERFQEVCNSPLSDIGVIQRNRNRCHRCGFARDTIPGNLDIQCMVCGSNQCWRPATSIHNDDMHERHEGRLVMLLDQKGMRRIRFGPSGVWYQPVADKVRGDDGGLVRLAPGLEVEAEPTTYAEVWSAFAQFPGEDHEGVCGFRNGENGQLRDPHGKLYGQPTRWAHLQNYRHEGYRLVLWEHAKSTDGLGGPHLPYIGKRR